MEKDLKLRFVCKWCDKKYPCGKSLGGHMRSHIIATNAGESEDKFSAVMSDTNLMKYDTPPPAMAATVVAASGGIGDEFDGPSGGYGLRENPKKTWRAVGSTFPLQQDRYCKQCGKGFQSLKALCGHMACHSVKERVLKDDHSWTSDDPKLAIAMDGHSDNEETEDLRRQTRSKSKRYKRHVLQSFQSRLSNNTSNDYDSSFVSEIDRQEQEEVAMYLIMLSRDTRYWGGVNSVFESSDNNSVILETKSSSIDIKTGRKGSLSLGGEALKMKKLGGKKFELSSLDDQSVQMDGSHSGHFRNGVRKLDSNISFGELFRCGDSKARGDDVYDAELGIRLNKREYNESGVNRSYSVERGSSEFGSSSKSVKYDQKKRTIDGLNSLEDRKQYLRRLIYDDSSDGELTKNAYKRSKYECLNCNKTFDSHQAFGGHRPCHKKVTVKFASKYESSDDFSPDSTPTRKFKSVGNKKQTSINVAKKTMTNKNKGQECPICFRMFKSGQALGGHKRSHFINGSEVFTNQTQVVKQENAVIHETIDLNLPAPKEDEKDR